MQKLCTVHVKDTASARPSRRGMRLRWRQGPRSAGRMNNAASAQRHALRRRRGRGSAWRVSSPTPRRTSAAPCGCFRRSDARRVSLQRARVDVPVEAVLRGEPRVAAACSTWNRATCWPGPQGLRADRGGAFGVGPRTVFHVERGARLRSSCAAMGSARACPREADLEPGVPRGEQKLQPISSCVRVGVSAGAPWR